MHDGYIFTLAICGTANASTPAIAAVNTMLAALPPVKRAALLGEVLPLDSSDSPHDTLIDEVMTDMQDAEVLLLVSPLYRVAAREDVALPARLAALLERATQPPLLERLRGRWAVLVGIDTADDAAAQASQGGVDGIVYRQMMLAPLQRFCLDAGLDVAGSAILAAPQGQPPEMLAPAQAARLDTLAQRAYAQARQTVPHALPTTQ
jgi:hypothetical protein